MNSRKNTLFADTCEYPEELRGLFEYDSMELRDFKKMIELIWGDDPAMKRWKLDVLHHYLQAKGKTKYDLPTVSLHNYML